MSKLAELVRSVETLSNLTAPMTPDDLACVLGLRVIEVPGAVFRLRVEAEGGSLTLDPHAPLTVQNALIARACASYVLRKAGALRTTSLGIGELAEALCNTPDPDGLSVPRTMFAE